MHVQALVRNVTSNSHVRCSCGVLKREPFPCVVPGAPVIDAHTDIRSHPQRAYERPRSRGRRPSGPWARIQEESVTRAGNIKVADLPSRSEAPVGYGRVVALETAAAPDAALLADLRGVVGDRARDNDFERGLYSRDGSIEGSPPAIVCLPETAAEIAEIVRVCRRHSRPFLARGSGTGLAGGAVPVGRPVVVATAKMDRIIEVDVDNRVAWVEPGVLNLDLSRALTPLGFHFAPDPSSQQVCSLGGNIANNSGGAALPRLRRHHGAHRRT